MSAKFLLSLLLASPAFTAPTPSTATITVSDFGLCGAAVHKTCTGSKFGPSCSWFGVCGSQSDAIFSGKGCQEAYGICGVASGKSSSSSSTGPACIVVPVSPSSTSSSATSTTHSSTTSTSYAASTSASSTSSSTSKPSSSSSSTATSSHTSSSSTSTTHITSSSSSLTSPSTTPTGTPLPTVTHTVTEANIAGTPVPITNGGFESSVAETPNKRSLEERQSSAQIAATTDGWTITQCIGTVGCYFENYDSFSGNWAYQASQGGMIAQTLPPLTIGSTYIFTYYAKTEFNTSATATTITAIFLDSGSGTNQLTVGGSPLLYISPNAPWAEFSQTLTVDCTTAQRYGTVSSDGTTVVFRLQIGNEACYNGMPCYVSPEPTYNWFLDEIRVSQTASGGSTC